MTTEMDADRKAALATLTDEERAAIESEDVTEEERAALAAVAGEDDDGDDGDDGDDDAADAAPIEGKGAAADDAAAPEIPPAGAPAAEDDDAPAFKPRYRADVPEDLDEQLAAIATEEAALAQRMKDGDIDVADFMTEQKRLSKEAAKLEGKRDQAASFEELNRQNAEQEWQWTVERFMRKVKKAEGVDYRGDAEKGQDFDGFVKVLAANPKNSDKDMEWFLVEAHKRTKALHGVTDKAPEAKPDEKKPDGKPAGRKAPTAGMPATLALVPGGDGPGDMGDEFSDLDALDGLEYEMALAKMTPAQRERYLQAA